MEEEQDFYLRYYVRRAAPLRRLAPPLSPSLIPQVGHKGKFGHEFLEFEIRPDGRLRYANNSNYKNDTMIRKQAYVSQAVVAELKRIVAESEIVREDDKQWPEPDRNGRQASPAAQPRLGRARLQKSSYALLFRPPTRQHLSVSRPRTSLRSSIAPPLPPHTHPPVPTPRSVPHGQEFEVISGGQHISFATGKIGSLLDVQESKDPEGLRVFYYLVQVSRLPRRGESSARPADLLRALAGPQVLCLLADRPPLSDQAHLRVWRDANRATNFHMRPFSVKQNILSQLRLAHPSH